MRADLHIHTVASDGMLTSAEVVDFAAHAGLGAIAVTDHDAVYSLPQVHELCQKANIVHINGIEISAYAGDVKIHTLGYGFNPLNGDFVAFLNKLRQGSFMRLDDIVSKLRKCGVDITAEECAAERVSPEVPVHIMHVCRAAVKKGYEGDVMSFFNKYVAYGKPAFSNICRPTPEEAVTAILQAGGFASIAHPGRIDMQPWALRAFIARLAGMGLGGIEAVYSAHTPTETAYFTKLAEEYGLLVTGGSDTHYATGYRKIGLPPFELSVGLRKRLNID